jgi:hypothetical protein
MGWSQRGGAQSEAKGDASKARAARGGLRRHGEVGRRLREGAVLRTIGVRYSRRALISYDRLPCAPAPAHHTGTRCTGMPAPHVPGARAVATCKSKGKGEGGGRNVVCTMPDALDGNRHVVATCVSAAACRADTVPSVGGGQTPCRSESDSSASVSVCSDPKITAYRNEENMGFGSRADARR